MKRYYQRTYGLTILLILLFTFSALASAYEAWLDFDQQQRRLSVDFSDVDLDDALQQTEEQTGIEFSINPGVGGLIDVQFDNAPLETAVKRLLSGYNYMMVHAKTETGEKHLSRVVVLSQTSERSLIETSVVTTPRPSISAPLEPAEVVLNRKNSGHYTASGFINGKAVEFLVDTGASTMAISGDLANHIGLGYGRAKQIDTANGRTTGFETTLYDVKLGDLALRNVRAIILPGMDLGRRVLLGMNVLDAFDLVKRGDSLIIRQYSGEEN